MRPPPQKTRRPPKMRHRPHFLFTTKHNSLRIYIQNAKYCNLFSLWVHLNLLKPIRTQFDRPIAGIAHASPRENRRILLNCTHRQWKSPPATVSQAIAGRSNTGLVSKFFRFFLFLCSWGQFSILLRILYSVHRLALELSRNLFKLYFRRVVRTL